MNKQQATAANAMAPDRRTLRIGRRELVRLLGWAWLLPAGAILRQFGRFLSYRAPAPDPARVALGTPATLPPLPAVIESARIFLQQDAAGYYALDNVCTHLGCQVRPTLGGGFACRCHGSRFNAVGQVISGPATRDLPYLELYWDAAGQLLVDRSNAVDPDTRLPAL